MSDLRELLAKARERIAEASGHWRMSDAKSDVDALLARIDAALAAAGWVHEESWGGWTLALQDGREARAWWSRWDERVRWCIASDTTTEAEETLHEEAPTLALAKLAAERAAGVNRG